MANYKKVFAWAGPLVLPLAVAGIRYLLRRIRGYPEQGGQGDATSKRDALDSLINTGLSGLSRTIGGSRRGSR